MARKILMFYGRDCQNSVLMIPILKGINLGGEKLRFEFHEVWHDEEAKKIKKQYQEIIKETGKPDAVPMFVDPEKNQAASIPDFEGLMKWLEGPEWWKKFK